MAKASKNDNRRNRYPAAVKAAFMKAARDARSAGKPWATAFSDARRAGYKGTVAGLEIMLRKAGRGGKAKKRATASGNSPAITKRQMRVLAQAVKQLRAIAAQLQAL